MENNLRDVQNTHSSLHSRLKAATSAIHHDLERTGYATRLLADDLKTGTYLNNLSRQLGFIAPIEKRLKEFDGLKTYVPDLFQRMKTAKLEADLQALGASADVEMATNLDLPPLSTLAEALGVLYVLEGSTLGGQLITKKLLQSSFINESNSSYYRAYGAQTGSMWRSFLKSLADFEASVGLESTESAVPAAVATFECLGRWFAKSPSPA